MIDLRVQAQRAGLRITPLPVDADGAQLADADALMITPAHQFPLGPTLAAHRRAAFVDWARERDAWLIEDDYDGEFRYDRQPVGALQGLDPERVVYAGTASKTLAPGIRVGWLALPEPLVGPVTDAKILADRVTSALDQLALAEMLRSGGFDAHLRRMRARYRRRRDALLELVQTKAPWIEPLGIAAGLHLVLKVDGERELLARAERVGLKIMPLSPMWHDPVGRPEGLVAGYGAAPEHAYAAALGALEKVLGDDRAA
jgi:GntR family transcriptional regulator/MocR family aminotransferase